MEAHGKMMVKNSEYKDPRNNIIKYTNVLIDTGKSLSRQVAPLQINTHEGSYGEDTYIHDIVAPFFNNIFYGEHLKHKWQCILLRNYFNGIFINHTLYFLLYILLGQMLNWLQMEIRKFPLIIHYMHLLEIFVVISWWSK